jgi:catechol 2,3-dioxygenase-like lactoylglutathione lyase family enzyme
VRAGRFHQSFPIIPVADVRRSLGFYSDLLGFERTYSFPSDDDPQFALLAIEDGKLGLAARRWARGNQVDRQLGDMDDVDAAVADLRAAGVRLWRNPPTVPGVSVLPPSPIPTATWSTSGRQPTDPRAQPP